MVPPGTPPRMVAAVVLAPSGAWPSVLEARWAIASDGTESTPQEGTMIDRVFVASQSYLILMFFFLPRLVCKDFVCTKHFYRTFGLFSESTLSLELHRRSVRSSALTPW